jgi:hypothetical protein
VAGRTDISGAGVDRPCHPLPALRELGVGVGTVLRVTGEAASVPRLFWTAVDVLPMGEALC